MIGLLILGALGAAALSSNKAGVSVTNDWNKYDSLFKRYGDLNSVPWIWLKAIALNESNLGRDPLVANKKWSSDGKSRGLMQLTIPTASDYQKGVTPDQLDDPETSVRIAAQYIGYLYKRYAGDPMKTIMSYNQGQGNTDKGKQYALDYFQRWQKNLDQVEASL